MLMDFKLKICAVEHHHTLYSFASEYYDETVLWNLECMKCIIVTFPI